MYMCTYRYTYTYTLTHTHAYTCYTYTYTCTYTYQKSYAHSYTHAHLYAYAYRTYMTLKYGYAHAHTHIYTLAQNCISNCWSGMYLTCNTTTSPENPRVAQLSSEWLKCGSFGWKNKWLKRKKVWVGVLVLGLAASQNSKRNDCRYVDSASRIHISDL